MDRCLTCQFFDRRDLRGGDAKSQQWGQCRRGAPMLNPVNSKPHMIEGVWPHVRGDDWCGEYKGLAQRLDARLSELMDDPLTNGLTPDSSGKPRFVPFGTPRDTGPGSTGN